MAELGREGFARRRIAIDEQVDVRYIGQSYEITLPFTPGYRRDFDRRHGQLYGYANADARGRGRGRARRAPRA